MQKEIRRKRWEVFNVYIYQNVVLTYQPKVNYNVVELVMK